MQKQLFDAYEEQKTLIKEQKEELLAKLLATQSELASMKTLMCSIWDCVMEKKQEGEMNAAFVVAARNSGVTDEVRNAEGRKPTTISGAKRQKMVSYSLQF
ncbi:MAG: hypothetical protein LC687_07960 [Actinobacteria bacterium]|nr:hypothetical protein [Actinomycetota bacterium]